MTDEDDENDGVGSSISSGCLSLRTSASSTQAPHHHHENYQRLQILEPMSDSIGRRSLQRATSQLEMAQLRLDGTKLYGRDVEIQQVTQAWKQLAAQPQQEEEIILVHRQLVLLEGRAGTGKSSVARQSLQPFQRDNNNHGGGGGGAGFFMSGKYDLQKVTHFVPYAAFTQACQELVELLLWHKSHPVGQQQQQDNHKWQFSFQELQTQLRQELTTAGTCTTSSRASSSSSAVATAMAAENQSEWQILTTVFPELRRIMEDDEGGKEAVNTNTATIKNRDDSTQIMRAGGYSEAHKNRFQYAFRRFMRVLCRFGPVVILLDDLQWADAASLDLIQSLMADGGAGADQAPSMENATAEKLSHFGLMILATYRSEEEVDALATTIQEIEGLAAQEIEGAGAFRSLQVTRLQVDNLNLAQVNEMLLDILAAKSPEDTLSLAECVHRKTKGNVFHVIQFLKSLVSESQQPQPSMSSSLSPTTGLLYFDIGTLQWVWDVEQVKLRESATNNVIEIIEQNLQFMPQEIRKMLPIVATLGSSFSYSVFERVFWHFNNNVVFRRTMYQEGEEAANILDPAQFLEVCEDEGLLVHDQRQGTIKWDHDKIQETALRLISAEELVNLQSVLGGFLLEDFYQRGQECSIFVIVGLLDGDISKLPKNDTQGTVLAELNATAGGMAMGSAAFASAAHYLARGVSVLPRGHWETHYALSLNLYSSAAEAHYCIGEMEAARKYCDVVCSRKDIRMLDKERAYIVLLDSIDNSHGDSFLAQEKCLEILAMLGCTFPTFGWAIHTIGGLMKTKFAVKSLEKELQCLPPMTDPLHRLVMRLLDRLVTYAFQTKSDIFPLVIMKGLKYTQKYGISDYSPPLISTVGLMLAAELGDLEGGKQLGELSLAFFSRTSVAGQISGTCRARTIFVSTAFCLHWQVSTMNLRKLYIDGYKSGLALGDVESAFWCIFCYIDTGFQNGVPLNMLEKDCQMYTKQMKDLKQEKACLQTEAIWQLVAYLLGRDVEGAFPQLANASGVDKAQHERCKLAAAFWSGEIDKAIELIEETGASKGYFDKAIAGAYGLLPLHFHCAMAYFSAFQKSKKSKHKRMGLLHSNIIQDWARKGNPNAIHCTVLIQAEISALKKNEFEHTLKLFKEAIKLCGRQGFLQVQALANERFGDFYLRHDFKNDAHYHLQKAAKFSLGVGCIQSGGSNLRAVFRQASGYCYGLIWNGGL